jgi:hypothetical protein
VGCAGTHTRPGELVSDTVFREEEIIQNNGKLIRMVEPVRRMYRKRLLSMGQYFFILSS